MAPTRALVRNNGTMSQATTMASPLHATRPNQVAVGTIVWLSSELMFFAGLFAMYFTLARRRRQTEWAKWTPHLNVPFAAREHLGACAVVVHGAGRRVGAERYQRRRTARSSTSAAGACRSGSSSPTSWAPSSSRARSSSTRDWSHEGLTISSSSVRLRLLPDHRLPRPPRASAASSRCCSCLAARSPPRSSARTRRPPTIVVSYYWHFVDVVWVALFTVIYLINRENDERPRSPALPPSRPPSPGPLSRSPASPRSAFVRARLPRGRDHRRIGRRHRSRVRSSSRPTARRATA